MKIAQNYTPPMVAPISLDMEQCMTNASITSGSPRVNDMKHNEVLDEDF